MQYTLEGILLDFYSDVFLISFMSIEMSMVLYNEKKNCSAAFSFRDLDTADGTAVVNAMYSI